MYGFIILLLIARPSVIFSFPYFPLRKLSAIKDTNRMVLNSLLLLNQRECVIYLLFLRHRHRLMNSISRRMWTPSFVTRFEASFNQHRISLVRFTRNGQSQFRIRAGKFCPFTSRNAMAFYARKGLRTGSSKQVNLTAWWSSTADIAADCSAKSTLLALSSFSLCYAWSFYLLPVSGFDLRTSENTETFRQKSFWLGSSVRLQRFHRSNLFHYSLRFSSSPFTPFRPFSLHTRRTGD